ncbi:MAG: hypothetical protein OEL89_03745 [Candidatus Peregrinibacteria bacterium]|nr:hypothetical protein [Candidatus Peregrinibacteria bacterium]
MSLNKLNSNFKSFPEKFSEKLEDQWTAISDGEILIHHEDFKIVFEKANEMGVTKKVIFHKVPKRNIIIV